MDEVNSEARNDKIHFSIEECIFLKHCLQTCLKCWIYLHAMYMDSRENRWHSLGVHHRDFFLNNIFSAELLFGKIYTLPRNSEGWYQIPCWAAVGGHHRPLWANITGHNCAMIFLHIPYVFPKEHQNTFILLVNSANNHRSHSSKETQEVQLKPE